MIILTPARLSRSKSRLYKYAGLYGKGVEEQHHLAKANHTRVPQIISDIVAPLLSPAERDCLLYIIRRTFGFSDGQGGRKPRDMISLDQFEFGISSGNYLLDLGTQLSRGTIKKALDGLQEKDLVDVRSSCTKCFWEETSVNSANEIEGQAPRCPRCKSTLSRSWALAEISPSKVVKLLNEYDKQGRTWEWDKASSRFRWQDAEGDQKRKRSQKELRDEALRLRRTLWYPKLVDKAVEMAEGQLRSGRKISLSRRINNFYKPVFDLQQSYPNPPLIKDSLEKTIAGPALRQPDTHRWDRYLKKVVENNEHRFTGAGPTPGTNAAAAEQASIRNRELAMRELLAKAANLNDNGNSEEARVLLGDILGQVDSLAELFDGDSRRCEIALREAFKQGSSDFVSIRPQPHGINFYPEWSWPSDLNDETTSAESQ